MFVKVSKQGSTLAGIMDAFSISISLGLQHGVPLATFVRKFANMKFEPAGITDDPELRIATSLIDYIFRRMAVDFLSLEERTELGILSTQERMQPTLPGVEEMATPTVGLVEDGLSGGRAGAEPAVTGAGPGRAARCAALLQLRQHHAAGGLVLRVRELRVDQRVLVRMRAVARRRFVAVPSDAATGRADLARPVI